MYLFDWRVVIFYYEERKKAFERLYITVMDSSKVFKILKEHQKDLTL